MIDLDAIEAAANGIVRPGEPFFWYKFDDIVDWCGPLVSSRKQAEADAHYIATMDPETTLALVARVRELELALEPFAQPVFRARWGGVAASPEHPVYGRNDSVLTLGDFDRAGAVMEDKA